MLFARLCRKFERVIKTSNNEYSGNGLFVANNYERGYCMNEETAIFNKSSSNENQESNEKGVMDNPIRQEEQTTELYKTNDEVIINSLKNKEWKALYEFTVGLKHRKDPPIPCQDSAFACPCSDELPVSIVVTADGAGSSAVSDIGAQRVTAGITRLIKTLGNQQFKFLNEKGSSEDALQDQAKQWSRILVKHARGILEDLEKEYRRPIGDFRCTLLCAVVGSEYMFWFKVGDGLLVVEEKRALNDEERNAYQLSVLGELGKVGEHANITQFIDNINVNDVQSGILPSGKISAVFSMSDGTAQRCVRNDNKDVATVLSVFSRDLIKGKLNRMKLTKWFYSDKFLENHDGDDCSIAFIAR